MRDLRGALEHGLRVFVGMGGYTEVSFASAPPTSTRGRLWKSGNIVPVRRGFFKKKFFFSHF